MSTRYLLDTNVLSRLVREPQGPVAQRIARVGEERICTSIVVACELRYGANDLLIAAHARSAGAVCVTGNVAEFRRVSGLRVENWLAA